MGVMCQILLHRPTEGYYRLGSPVTGILKYAIDETTEYKEIKISLQGKGECRWTENRTTRHGNKHGRTNQRITYTGTEEYVNIKMNVLNGPALVQVGAYEHPFKFILPHNLPSSYKDNNCKIWYCIKMKFVRPGLFNFTKRFYIEIAVKGSSLPVLPQQPICFDLEKTLIKLFKSNQQISLKSIIQKTVFEAGEPVEVNFQITNNSTATIPGIQARLYEVKTYRANCGKMAQRRTEVTGCVAGTPSIPESSTANRFLRVPSNGEMYSVSNSRIFSREYKLQVTVKLPFPHINASRDIDVVFNDPKTETGRDMETYQVELPPPYWAVMAEDELKDEK